jgi:2-iminobutanoate/2-iminopropanoate deaminase
MSEDEGSGSMARQLINPAETGPVSGFYSKGVQIGNRVFVSGQVARGEGSDIVGAGDLDQQLDKTFGNIESVLREAGGSMDHMAMTRTHVTSVQYRNLVGDARRARGFTGATSTLAVVNSLADPRLLVEIGGIAHVGGDWKVFNPDTVPQTPGSYNQGVQIDDTLYVAGQIALDAQGNLVGRGDPVAQADQAAQNVVRVIESAGGSADDVVYICLYVTNPAYIDAVRSARQKYGLVGCPSTLVVIPSLATADYLVEIEAIAVIGTEKTIIRPDNVHTVSPRYEHAVVAGDTVYLAGQVSADVDGNIVGKGDAEAQARQLFENMANVLHAAGAGLDDVVSTTTYLTNLQHRDAVNRVREEIGLTAAASTGLVISALALPDYVVEVEAIAVVDDR